MMSIVKSQLRILCDQEPTTWEDHLSRIIFQYNISYQESIKTVPFVALYGRKPIIPAHHLFESAQSTPLDQEIEPTLNEQVARFETLRNVQQQVKVQIEEAQTKAKENYARWIAKKRKRIDDLAKDDYALCKNQEPFGASSCTGKDRTSLKVGLVMEPKELLCCRMPKAASGSDAVSKLSLAQLLCQDIIRQ
jgi:hypothetical protein